MITQKFEPTVKNAEKTSGTEITSNSLENEASTPRANSERSAAIPEVKVETIETPVSSPRVSKRASKPGRPGKEQSLLSYLVTSTVCFLQCHKREPVTNLIGETNNQTRVLVSKETVVLRRWGSETQNFGFIN